jgi:hypothetical protein
MRDPGRHQVRARCHARPARRQGHTAEVGDILASVAFLPARLPFVDSEQHMIAKLEAGIDERMRQ